MKKTTSRLAVLALVGVLAGCGQQAVDQGGSSKGTSDEKEAKIRKNLDKLPDEDRKLAEQQKYCAVETESRLGSMGKPVKEMVKGEPVFLCCSGCQKEVKKDPDRYAEVAKKLRQQSGAAEQPKK